MYSILLTLGYYGGYGMRRGMMFDWTYILALIGLGLTLVAQARVKNVFYQYQKVHSASGLTGAQAAELVLRNFGISDVTVEKVAGSLTDHYDPSTKTLRLSESTYGSGSVAAIFVAAHECGHAKQDADHYAPLVLRSALVPAAGFGSKLAWPVFLAGMLFSIPFLTKAGIILFSLAVLFQLVTLPVEFDASARAIRLVSDTQMLPEEELPGGKKVLTAAALTDVAALASSMLQLVRLVLLSGRRGRD